ncbi:HNH endonuclease [Tokyovirus A1]|uniref:HNH endonuclease n=1 Tax=Tokyovirus A1 TaxID=1826170 RepID=UPI0007A9711F|nr:HNH endonuclease [Tokyovirus A1]BAU80158.1 restriction endonuclease [Tokyovirus A1]
MNSKIPCAERKQGLCGLGECVYCFPKSFASHPLSKHWSENNKETPNLVVLNSRKVVLFVCDCGHEYERKPFDVSKRGLLCLFCKGEKLCGSPSCEACKQISFASHEKAQCWSEKNGFSPETVTQKHSKKCWFECPKCSHSFQQEPRVVCLPDKSKGKRWCPYCANQKKCEDEGCEHCLKKSLCFLPPSLSWSKRNSVVQRQVSAGSKKKHWFECKICSHSFQMAPGCITHQKQGCPYCCNQKRCEDDTCGHCFKNSFASHNLSKLWSNKNIKTPRQVSLWGGKSYLFECDVCLHEFSMELRNINAGQRCPYCACQKLCDSKDCKMCFEGSFAAFPQSSFWSSKNERSPRQVRKGSGKKYKFQCEKKHLFETPPRNVRAGSWCPLCKSKTEAKVFSWLLSITPLAVHQARFSWCINPETGKVLPFDICVADKFIVEIDGRQHFEQVSNWTPPEETQERDKLKEELAKNHGFQILRLSQRDVWEDSLDWKNQIKEFIKEIF